MEIKIQNLKEHPNKWIKKIGCEGWNYADWKTKTSGETVFYPHGTHSNQRLAVYARAFERVEVDSIFWKLSEKV